MNALFELASLTDMEAAQCLNRILSGIKSKRKDIPVTSPNELSNILSAVAAKTGRALTPKIDEKLSNREKAVRVVLIEFLDEPDLKKLLERALASNRRVLVEPITTALVMAGIILVLKTRTHFKFKRDKNGKWEAEGSIDAKPSSEGLLKKFFGLF